MKKEFLCLSGFLKDDRDDDSLKYEIDIPLTFQEPVLAILGCKSFNDSHGNGWELEPGQVDKISMIIGQSLPKQLSLYIEVVGSD
jgi:hypothetical protein